LTYFNRGRAGIMVEIHQIKKPLPVPKAGTPRKNLGPNPYLNVKVDKLKPSHQGPVIRLKEILKFSVKSKADTFTVVTTQLWIGLDISSVMEFPRHIPTSRVGFDKGCLIIISISISLSLSICIYIYIYIHSHYPYSFLTSVGLRV
jgi:hypothetical protein